ncbi:hypothetical protein [Rhizobium sp. BK399]|uniref:hypothetical protein n=1 Tax=Rhizobium sp. BK399 TaxID=2587063 RepID=UPI00161939AA|nr:hypothetical protein [Rhizobium sp. BK399]MBB3543839.1 hypothetical protein [Rhizobium sp. BK399]
MDTARLLSHYWKKARRIGREITMKRIALLSAQSPLATKRHRSKFKLRIVGCVAVLMRRPGRKLATVPDLSRWLKRDIGFDP